jgi:flavin reductase (NADH)
MLSAATGTAHDSVTDDFGVSDAEFLDAMAALAGGACVVTTAGPDGKPGGFTATAVMSLSRSPQLIAIGVGESSRTLPVLLDRRAFALNVLHAGAESIAHRFAAPDADRFAGLDGLAWTTGGRDGQPLPLLLGHSLYVLACRVTQEVRAGDHRLVIAAVEHVLPGTGEAAGTGALVHVGRRYHALETEAA